MPEQDNGRARTLRPEDIARVVIRPVGTVLPLGFFVFATGAFLTATYSAGWIPVSQGRVVFELLLIFVLPVQTIAVVFAFLSRDSAGGTTMGVFAATWGALAVIGMSLKPGETSDALGVFLLADCAVIFILALASLAGNPAFTVILLIGCARFATNGVYQLTGHTGYERVSGWVGIVLAVVAAYAGLAFLLEDGRHEPVLPFVREGRAKERLDFDLTENVRRLESEPGVRTQL
jgi:succinate-acetate transporter protein